MIDTPTDEACKDYIGNAAAHAQLAVVFAQLIVGGESHGVHALVVPLRDERGSLHPGVRIEDCGEKMGLNGVDNGTDLVRPTSGCPGTHCSNRYGGVNDEGAYESPIEKPGNRRFFTMLGAPRAGPGVHLRRLDQRGEDGPDDRGPVRAAGARQFGPPDEPEVVLLDYRTHQRRLMPLLAKTYALHFAQAELREQLPQSASGEDETTEREQREARVAGRRDEGRLELARHRDDPDLSRVLRRRRLPERATGSRRSRPTPTSSPRSRATTPC